MGKKTYVAVRLALDFVYEHQELFQKWLEGRVSENFISHSDKVMGAEDSINEKVQKDIGNDN